MIDSFIHHGKPISADEVDLTLSMSSTGVWKQGAELDAIVEVAARFLSLYKGVDPSNKDLKATLLEDFETVWRVIIDGLLSTHPMLGRHFSDGGYLIQELIVDHHEASGQATRGTSKWCSWLERYERHERFDGRLSRRATESDKFR